MQKRAEQTGEEAWGQGEAEGNVERVNFSSAAESTVGSLQRRTGEEASPRKREEAGSGSHTAVESTVALAMGKGQRAEVGERGVERAVD